MPLPSGVAGWACPGNHVISCAFSRLSLSVNTLAKDFNSQKVEVEKLIQLVRNHECFKCDRKRPAHKFLSRTFFMLGEEQSPIHSFVQLLLFVYRRDSNSINIDVSFHVWAGRASPASSVYFFFLSELDLWEGGELFTYDLQQWHWAKCFPISYAISVCPFVTLWRQHLSSRY